ncbi:hypothetical protein V6N12_051910 [Hibiscus sabdariffa]|uniref:Uncharacterized protein n=1 Tax=Hibiscus sabdariffa TaxID=183260 RepID=A0ABR2GGP9_9ROSI
MALIQETKKSSLVEEDIRKFWYDDELEFCFGEASGSSGRLVGLPFSSQAGCGGMSFSVSAAIDTRFLWPC